MADKIRFNDYADDKNVEYEPTDSEDDYSEEEKELLRNVRESHKRQVEDKKQILAFDESDDEEDEEEEDNAEQMEDSDIEGAAKEEGLPNEMDWGDQARNYYNTDFVDRDYDEYNEEEMEMAQQEEEEAKNIQLRLLKQMKEADFQLDAKLMQAAEAKLDSLSGEATKIKADLSGLSKREQQRLFLEDSPEFAGLTENFVAYLEEQQHLVMPVLDYVRSNKLPLIPAFKFAQLHQNLVFTYCTNVSFYLLLKAKRVSIRSHPVIKRLLSLQLLIKQLSDKYENIIRPQLEALLERIKNGDVFEVLDIEAPKVKPKAKLNILDAYEQVPDVPQDATEAHSSDDEEEEQLEEELEEGQADERRGITYQIAKNKGLTPHRKKELRNPRVKHRTKFRKALIRRKGAVRTVRKETKRYGGEMSGIKSTVSKSIKFKV